MIDDVILMWHQHGKQWWHRCTIDEAAQTMKDYYMIGFRGPFAIVFVDGRVLPEDYHGV